MAFDQNRYRKIFEERHGQGSYERGLNLARETGRSKAAADYAKQAYQQALKERQKKEKNKTYSDAVTDFSTSPDLGTGTKLDEMLKNPRKNGASRNEEEIRNDPALQERIKDMGYSVDEFINAMYNAATDGQFRSSREYKQYSSKVEQDAKNKPEPWEVQAKAAEKQTKITEDNRGLLERLGDFVKSKDVDKDGERDGFLGALDRLVVPISKGATEAIFPGNTEKMAQNDPDNPVVKAAQKDRGIETKALNAVGTIGAFAAPYSKAYKAADLAVNKIPSLARIANPYAQKAVTGAIAGGLAEGGVSAVNELANPDAKDIKDYALQTGLGIAGGAILDPAMHGIYNLIKGARGARKSAQQSEEVLGLPEPQMQLPEPNKPSLERLTNLRSQGLQSPIPEMPNLLRQKLNQANLEQQGLNFGQGSRYQVKPRYKNVESEQNQSYWQGRYEDFAKHVNDNYDMNQMTPEALEDIWTQFARYDEPYTLDEVIDLSYPKGFEAQPKANAAVQEVIDPVPNEPNLDLLRADNEVPNQPVSRVATPEEIVQQMEEAVAANPRISPPELKPLEFKRSIKVGEALSKLAASRPGSSNQGDINLLKRLRPGQDYEPIEPLSRIKNTQLETAATSEQPSLERLQAIRPSEQSTASLDRLKASGEYEAISPMPVAENEYGIVRANDPIWNVKLEPNRLKDINGIQGYMSDVYRNTRDVFGDKFPEVKKAVLDPFDKSKKEHVELQENWLKKLDKEVVKGLGIKKDSKLSKLVQDYGEKTISLDELKKAAPQEWKKVVKADQWFRQAYDQLIDQVNASRELIYPNNPDKLVPKRGDYYRHFNELEGLEGLRNMFDTPAGIDPQLVGTSDFTNPRSKWAGFMQKRGLGPYKSDAVGGFLNYLPSASYAIKIDPHIPVFKEFSKSLKEATGNTKNLNHYIEFLEDFTRDLAGKTNFLDRPVQKIVGRKAFNGLQWLNNRVKKNTILGNLGSTLAQVANVPNGIAFAKQHSIPGAARTLKSIMKEDVSAQSGFLKERFSSNMYQQFNSKLLEQPEKFAGWIMNTVDQLGTSFVWNSAYEKGLAQKVADPVKYADDATRNLVAGRGIGEVPLLQKSKTFQFIAPFQLEVANLWQVQRDFVKEKDFGAVLTLYLGAWMLNKGMEETRGSGVTFDPIDAITDAFSDEDLSGWERTGRVAGEVLSNVPLGQTLANFYPEYGNDFLPTRENFFGDNDPNRFGSGLLVAKGVQDPLAKLLLPFGGVQAQKSIKGLDALKQEAVYNKDETKLKYPVETDLSNRLKGALFGLGGLRETREFYDNDRTPLGEKQTLQFESLGNPEEKNAYYNYMMLQREADRLKQEIKAVQEDPNLSEEEKNSRIQELAERLGQLTTN